jgi:hypothetical protein
MATLLACTGVAAPGPGAALGGAARTAAVAHADLALAAPTACASVDAAGLAGAALQPLAPQVWWRPGEPGDSNAQNRGAISNLLVVADGDRLWLIGSGPSAEQGRALAQQLLCQLGQAPTDVISPWPRPELVLGQGGMPDARSWAHASVAEAMAQRCGVCIERLRLRLNTPADAPAEPPPRLPDRRLQGDQGQLGPFDWWRLERGGDTPVTVWRHRASGIATAHGLLWTDGAPDLRDTHLDDMVAATQALLTLPGAPAPVRLWLPEQGTPAAGDAPAGHLRYWAALEAAVTQAQADGQAETDPAPDLAGIDARLNHGPRHALNWQRAWREVEGRWLDAQRGVFQRNLR